MSARSGGVQIISRERAVAKFINEVLGNDRINQILVQSMSDSIGSAALLLHVRAVADPNDPHSEEISVFDDFFCDRRELEIIREKLAKAGAESGREIKIVEFSERKEGEGESEGSKRRK